MRYAVSAVFLSMFASTAFTAPGFTEKPSAVRGADGVTIRFAVSEPTDAWLAGMATWAELVQNVGFFKGRYASLAPERIVRDVCSLDLCRSAAAELRERGLIK